ncbi:dihydroorotase [Elysia marginata]|uniref:Dihydroorotase n=1 Tax=Elysia marginata TaxID=1093978 RepID=A0AAV4FWU4_9GAST|nr:dihydroorotase [Elysia marginata]
METIVKSAKICIEGNRHHNTVKDVVLSKGKIIEIGSNLKTDNRDIIAFENLHISLGWFDSSVSFGEPGFEERETMTNGTKVSRKSGFTDILLNSNTSPPPTSGTHIKSLLSMGKNTVNIYPIGCLVNNRKLAELYDMKNCGAVSFGNYKTPIEDASILKLALQYSQNFDARVQSFPLNKNIAGNGVVNEGHSSLSVGLKGIAKLSETLQVQRDISILEYTGGKLHIPTISSKETVALIKQAKKKGLDVSCSVAIHNIIFDDTAIKGFETDYKVLPPLRKKEDIKALINGIKDGVIDMVTTDHCPINIENKNLEFEQALFGTIGLESAFGILQTIFETGLTISLLTKGRAVFGIPEPKFEIGEACNITLFNPDTESVFTEKDILSSSKNSAFIDRKTKGNVYGSILGKSFIF